MPPRKAKQNASTSSTDAIPSHPAPPTATSAKPDERVLTPEESPKKKEVGITQAQKQALIDNLQLEITERARKLRAQYALQAQGLRSRLEMRVNRIPQALRKRKMQDLLNESAEKANPKPAPPVLVQEPKAEGRKNLKRQSDQISSTADEDKENVGEELPNPKKRTKTTNTTAAANAKPPLPPRNNPRTKAAAPSTVLSPKSQNSRTLPRLPFKPASPEKPFGRPASPPKPHIATQQAATKGGRTASRQQPPKRNAAGAPEKETRTSEASDTSAGTTIVRKAAPAAKGRPAVAAKKSVAAKKPAVGAAAKKKENVAPSAGGRTLRKRT